MQEQQEQIEKQNQLIEMLLKELKPLRNKHLFYSQFWKIFGITSFPRWSSKAPLFKRITSVPSVILQSSRFSKGISVLRWSSKAALKNFNKKRSSKLGFFLIEVFIRDCGGIQTPTSEPKSDILSSWTITAFFGVQRFQHRAVFLFIWSF